MSFHDLVSCRCEHALHSHLQGENCMHCDCAYFIDADHWKRWCKDAFEGRMLQPVFNRWCNQWRPASKKFEGDAGPCEFENFVRRVAPPFRVSSRIVLVGDGRTMVLWADGAVDTISSTLLDSADDNEPADIEEANVVDTIESLVLAHACAGVDVRQRQYIEGLNTTINAIFK